MYLQLFSIKDSLLGLKDGGEGCREQCTTHPHSCTCVPPTCGSGVGQSAADVALGEASVVGFDRNQPNHLNPELWQAQVSQSKRQAGEAATSPTDGSRTVPAAPPCTADTQTDLLPKARLGEGSQAQYSHASHQLQLAHLVLTRRHLCRWLLGCAVRRWLAAFLLGDGRALRDRASPRA